MAREMETVTQSGSRSHAMGYGDGVVVPRLILLARWMMDVHGKTRYDTSTLPTLLGAVPVCQSVNSVSRSYALQQQRHVYTHTHMYMHMYIHTYMHTYLFILAPTHHFPSLA